jgi:SNF2 family DNA or RNA helicase
MLKVLRLHASNPEEQALQRKEVAEHGTSYDVIVTTYDMCKVPQLMSMWSRLYFRLLVLDEGHKIKSRDTKIAEAVRKIHCENRLLLTGTPRKLPGYDVWVLAYSNLLEIVEFTLTFYEHPHVLNIMQYKTIS